VREHDLPVIPPLFQDRIWGRMAPGDGPERLAGVIEELSREDDRFNIEGGSWTNDVSLQRGYDGTCSLSTITTGHSSDPRLARIRGTPRARQVPPQAQPAVDVLWPAGLGDQRQHGGGGRGAQISPRGRADLRSRNELQLLLGRGVGAPMLRAPRLRP